MPSDVENAPISLLEAMNAGRAIVTTNTTGCYETAGDSDLLVDPHDTNGIKNAVFQFAHDESLIDEFGKRARKRSIEKFSWDMIIEEYLKLYRKICK